MTLSGKDYINDLIPNSGAIQAINDDFRHIVQNLHLWSFYESVKTNLGVSQALIVEKDSAILGIDFFPNFILKLFLFVCARGFSKAYCSTPGLPKERVQLLNADHRHVCKFRDTLDSNYITLRNAFVSTIDQIERECKYLHVLGYRYQPYATYNTQGWLQLKTVTVIQ